MKRLEVGDRLPDLRLPRAGDHRARPLRGPHRDAVVVVALHDPRCEDCRVYLRDLAGAAPAFRTWDGVVRAVTDIAGPVAELQGLDAAVEVLVDADRELLGRVEATTGPATLVADRYGQVFHIEAPDAADVHPVVEPRELEEWLKYLATQCPE